jgi:predicted ABC-type ATPase
MDAHAYIIAGPNGAGKTTFAKDFLPNYTDCREFLNADLVAAGISPFDPDAAAISAGRVLLSRMRQLISQRRDFGFETTLAGRAYVSLFRQMKDRGYRLHLFYLWLPSVELAIARVADRVELGGHNVPEDVIRRRFAVGGRNLIESYLPLFDTWMLFDSSTHRPREVACSGDGGIRISDSVAYRRICDAAEEHRS